MADAKSLPVGSGLANTAKIALQTKQAYDQHVLDAQENGDKPLPYDAWMKQHIAEQAAAATQAQSDQKAGYSEANK